MAHQDRIALISEIENLRQSKIICYLTSVRPNMGAQMGQDAVRIFLDHLLLLPEKKTPKLDVFICSNGGDGVVPWRLISLLREFTDHVGVIVPFRAYSAATMLAIGANEIVMHPFAEMGPIDPSVSNDFNPVDPQSHQRVSISVEDVKAYVGFIKDTVGIRHEDELIKAIEILANKVHPLALGNVERFIAQSRMIAGKLLRTHMKEEDEHKIGELVETLASKLYFHGHPISRREATELGLNVAPNISPQLETAIWKLYLDFEKELQNNEPFDPLADIFKQVPAGTPIIPPGTFTQSINKMAFVECCRLSSVFAIDRRIVVAGNGPQGEPAIRAETISQSWQQTPAPAPARAPEAKPKKKAR